MKPVPPFNAVASQQFFTTFAIRERLNSARPHFGDAQAQKLKDRLIKNENKLFTFLKFDGIPWNNNNAEHAVKAFATLRRIIGGVTTTKGIRAYMILLSICETCDYRKLDFLDFLRSSERNIDVFASKLRKQLNPPLE